MDSTMRLLTVVCVLLLHLGSVHGLCKSLLFSGHSSKADVNGRYNLVDSMNNDKNVWFNTNEQYYIYYYYNWFEFGFGIGGSTRWTGSLVTEEESPDKAGSQFSFYDMNDPTLILCDEAPAGYIAMDGTCSENIIEDISTTGNSQTLDSCGAACSNSEECVGFSISSEGCFPTSASCVDSLTVSDLGGWYYHSGLLYDYLIGKEAYQSSTHPNWLGSADQAIDGILSGSMIGEHICSHTQIEIQPWWMVDTGGLVKVSTVIIQARKDCCAKELVNYRVALKSYGSPSEDLALLESVGPDELNVYVCADITTPAEFGERVFIDCGSAYATYLIIYSLNTIDPTSLVLCEVEMLQESAVFTDHYYVVNTRGDSDSADSLCEKTFGGSLADIKDEYERTLIQQYLQTLDAIPESLYIDKRANDAKFERTISSRIQLLTKEGNLPVCDTSATTHWCQNALDITRDEIAWIPTEITDSYYTIELRYEYSIHGVAIKQYLNNILEITLELDEVEVGTYELPDTGSTDSFWYYIDLPDGSVATTITIRLISFRSNVNTGFIALGVYGADDFGWSITGGYCGDGNAIADADLLSAVDIDTCLLECQFVEGCVGVETTVAIDGFDCVFRSAVCDPADRIEDELYTLWEIADSGVTYASSAGSCNGADGAHSQATTPQECALKCSLLEGCVGFNWAWSGVCWPTYSALECSDEADDVYGDHSPTYFTMITGQDNAGRREDYVGCYVLQSYVPWTSRELAPLPVLDECKAHCAANYTFIAVFAAVACHCSNVIGEEGSSTSCTVSCLFKPDDMCGAQNSYNAYSTAQGFCESSPCQYGGTCQESVENIITCDCPAGTTGYFCETDINECDSDPCVQGNCEDQMGGYFCNCYSGYSGLHCDIDINECDSSPCENGGTCSDSLNKYQCSCLPGTLGLSCETDLDECASAPCKNEGLCNDKIGGYSCLCKPGYQGARCEIDIDDCESSPCESEGTCIDDIASYSCDCVLGFAGFNCEIELKECASYPCQNDATCVDKANEYECDCVTGYEGINCEIDIDDCNPNPCFNEAFCVDLVDGYECLCHPGFGGDECDFYIGNPGDWTSWGNWTECDVTCGQGISYRMRECVPMFEELGLGLCYGMEAESQDCNLATCPPVDGNWGAWFGIGGCSVTCGPGVTNATRQCNYPPPSNGGQNCSGEQEQFRTQICQERICSTNADCGKWSDWTECAGACGSGKTNRQRVCKVEGTAESDTNSTAPSAANGTTIAEKTKTEEKTCNVASCKDERTCSVCKGSYNSNSATLPNCDVGQACASGEKYCSVTYSAEGSNLKLDKKCSKESDCTHASKTVSSKCNSLFGLGVINTITPVSMIEAVTGVWASLNSSCTICCDQNGCNSGTLPTNVYYREPSKGQGLHYSNALWLIIGISMALNYIMQ